MSARKSCHVAALLLFAAERDHDPAAAALFGDPGPSDAYSAAPGADTALAIDADAPLHAHPEPVQVSFNPLI